MLRKFKIFFNKGNSLVVDKIERSDFFFLKRIYQDKKIRLLTSGKSMWPTIKEGQIIIVEVVASQKLNLQIRKNDTIAFYAKLEKKIIAHRVIDKRKKGNIFYYQTKGDNIKSKDLVIVSSKYILGKVLI